MSNPSDIVILGAPRSGTNMLRDVLTALPGYSTWNCDEVNPLWRHGNRAFPSDELTPDLARPEVREFLQSAFKRLRRRTGARAIVEKTCANSLRPMFVHRVLPDARFLIITRDGLDAAVSASQRWNARLDLRYTAAKARYVPVSDVPYYGARFLEGKWRRRRGMADNSASSGWWGPKPHDWPHLVSSHPLDELAMIQWKRCVSATRRGSRNFTSRQVHHVVYEEFVRDPAGGLRDILAFLGDVASYDERAIAGVNASSIGRGRESLTVDARNRLQAIAADTLKEFGYES